MNTGHLWNFIKIEERLPSNIVNIVFIAVWFFETQTVKSPLLLWKLRS